MGPSSLSMQERADHRLLSFLNAPNFASLQGSDGNFCIYTGINLTPVGPARWCAGTQGHPNDALFVQDDGNVVIRDFPSGTALWQSFTARF